MKELAPFYNGHSYQNYPRDVLTDYRYRYWGEAFDELLTVKEKYDPGNVFTFAQAITAYPPGTRPASHPEVKTRRFRKTDIDYEPFGEDQPR